MTKLTNLEIIKKAAEMGYSAKIKRENSRKKERVIVGATDNTVLLRGLESCTCSCLSNSNLLDNIEQYSITGFLYVGHLFGEPKIQEGQRFRVRETGEIISKGEENDAGEFYFKTLDLDDHRAQFDIYKPSELEPVFE